MVYYEWVTHWLWISQSFILLLCRLCRHQPTNRLVKHPLKKKILCKWLTEYLTEWSALHRLCTSSEDIHVCSLANRLTCSFSLPPAFVCHPHHPLCLFFCCPTEQHPLSLCPHLSVTFIIHSDSPLTSLGESICPSKACPDFLSSASFFGDNFLF